jgi:hypothetical protein
MAPSLLTTFLRLLGLRLLLSHNAWIFLSFLKHFFELLHDLLIDSFNLVFFYFLADGLHFLDLPTCHEPIDLFREVSYSYIFGDHCRHIS